MVARLDIPRAALRLSDDELGAAVMLLAAPGHASLAEPATREAIDALTSAGIVRDGTIEGFPARMLAVVAAPKLRVTVESFVGVETVVEQGWATEREGVWGTVAADGQIELTPLEPSLIPWAVAHAVGLGPRDRPAGREIAVPAQALGSATELLATGDPDGAAGALAALDPDDRATLLALLRERRLSWRASSAWTEQDGTRQARSVAVLDAGIEGLWLTRHDGTAPDTIAHLQPVPPSAVWDRVTGLMPSPEA